MKNIATLRFLLGLVLLFVMPIAGRAQCSNQITVSYYDNGVFTTQTVNNGQSGFTASVCPIGGAQYDFSGSSTSNAVLTWSRVITRGNTSANDVVQDLSTASGVAGTVLNASVSFTASTVFRFEADTRSYSGSCNKIDYIYLTLTPSLTLTSPDVAGVCAGSTVVLQASGATSGTYTWLANGTPISNQTGSTLTVTPAATTTYTVAATTSCGSSSQQLTIPVFGLAIEPSAPTTCPSEAITLQASYNGASATYQWFEKNQPTVLSSGSTVSVAPTATTTYEVVATSTDCNTITKEVTVTVGTPSVAVASGNRTICAGSSTVLTANSGDPNAAYSWAPSTGLSATTGASVTARPTTATTYTVTATTACGTATSDVEVLVAPAATYAVTPASATICAGTSIALTASSNISSATYRWYASTDLGTAISTSAELTVAPSATTTYRVLTASSCGNNSQDVTVDVTTIPVAVTPPSATLTYGASTTLTASGGTSYRWTATTGNSTTLLSNTTASILVTPSYTTTYTATAIEMGGACNTAQAVVGVSRPLPVELIGFDAIWADHSPRLVWATASEKNSAYFVVERSLDGVLFREIGQRTSAGNATVRTDYLFVDLSLVADANATVYYRLRQVDATGEEGHYSPVRTVQVPAGPRQLSAAVFPNPYESTATVQFQSLSAEPVRLTVVNTLGQTVLTFTAPAVAGLQEVQLPKASALPAGLYYLTIRQGNQRQVLPMSHK